MKKKDRERMQRTVAKAMSKTKPAKKAKAAIEKKAKLTLSKLNPAGSKAARMIAGAASIAQSKEIEVPVSENVKLRLKGKKNDKGASIHFKKRF